MFQSEMMVVPPGARRQFLNDARVHVVMAIGSLLRAGQARDEARLLNIAAEMLAERTEKRDACFCEAITAERIAKTLRNIPLDPGCSPSLAYEALQLADQIG